MGGEKEVKNTYKTFVGDTEEVTPLGRPWPRSENMLN